jgi:hypothetical protein
MQDTLKHLSRRMSSLLRHRAGEVGLRMDAAGWVELDELIAHSGEPRHLVVYENSIAMFSQQICRLERQSLLWRSGRRSAQAICGCGRRLPPRRRRRTTGAVCRGQRCRSRGRRVVKAARAGVCCGAAVSRVPRRASRGLLALVEPCPALSLPWPRSHRAGAACAPHRERCAALR